MPALNKDEFNETLKALIGDRTDDDALKAIENLTDTYDTFSDSEQWKNKYEENDKLWREKYKARFLDGDSDSTVTEQGDDDDDDKEETIDDLFIE